MLIQHKLHLLPTSPIINTTFITRVINLDYASARELAHSVTYVRSQRAYSFRLVLHPNYVSTLPS